MRSKDFINETIEILSEKIDVDEIIPILNRNNFNNIKKINRFRLKVIVPNKLRFKSSEEIKNLLPGSELSPDFKKVIFQGSTILIKPQEAQTGRLDKESGQIIALNSAIEEKLKDNQFIRLIVGGRVVNATSVNKVHGNAKADAEILDNNGEPVAWISLKNGSNPRDMNQWGGISEFTDHPEVQEFTNSIRNKFGNTFHEYESYGKLIKDSNLKAKIVFGKNFGGSRGLYNVDMVLQGNPILKKINDTTYLLIATHYWKNGNIPTSTYDPVFLIKYTNGRRDFGIIDARINCYPTAGRNWKNIDEVKDKKKTIRNISTTLNTSTGTISPSQNIEKTTNVI